MQNIQILIVDYGSQYTLVIGRTLRELGYRSVILSPFKASQWLKSTKPKAVILSGSNWSVYNQNAPSFPEGFDHSGKEYFILGVCYGMQLLSYKLGGKVDRPLLHREYGPSKVSFDNKHPLFKDLPKESIVWASHGDTVEVLPEGFYSIATSGGHAAMSNENGRVLGIQFHPEVSDTKEGKKILQNFLNISGCAKDWEPRDLAKNIQDEVLENVGKSGKIILGFSGGVDSTTLASVLAPVLGERLVCIAIDTGAMREGEIEEVKANAISAGIKELQIIYAKDDFIKSISEVVDAEEKRTRFRDVYKNIFETQIKKYEARFILQGTLATDLIESGELGESALIKTHHNVGLDWEITDLHPFRNLFKYEVRELGSVFNLPARVYDRNPFPGPGLFVRIVGTPVSLEKLEIVRKADKIVADILKTKKIEKDISQLIVALLGIDSVGVKGDERVYGHALVVRAVQTSDFMTAQGYYFSKEISEEITNTLCKIEGIVRVFFDITPKPPATTEFE